MKYSIFIITLVILFSCSKEDFQPKYSSNQLLSENTIYPDDIDHSSILPDVANYYENIIFLARWYASHPQFRFLPVPTAPTDPVNTVLQKLESIILIDSTGNQISLFDLNEEDLQNFLRTWKEFESYGLSQKLRKDSSGLSLGLIHDRNAAFNAAIGNLKSADLVSEDPFFKVKAKLEEQEKKAIELQEKLPFLKSSEYSDDNFWAIAVSNFLLSYSIIHIAPNSQTPQSFVEHLRPNLQKGRILISLPGGWTTSSLLVLYPNKICSDVGHVAIISKNKEEIPDSIDDKFNLTIGTGVTGTIREELGQAWCIKHGVSFLGQVCQVRWEIYRNEKKEWNWRKVTTEVDNESIANEAVKYLGVPYCSILNIFFSKWVAPKSFICSSLAWYCAKESTGLNISDWWSTTIFPRDIYFSENIEIVDNTFE